MRMRGDASRVNTGISLEWFPMIGGSRGRRGKEKT